MHYAEKVIKRAVDQVNAQNIDSDEVAKVVIETKKLIGESDIKFKRPSFIFLHEDALVRQDETTAELVPIISNQAVKSR